MTYAIELPPMAHQWRKHFAPLITDALKGKGMAHWARHCHYLNGASMAHDGANARKEATMNSTEFLALRKIQKEGAATDYEVAQFLDLVNAGNSSFKAEPEMAMIEVADESYQPDGTPPLPAWCASCPKP